jgi:hypothetical protein
MGVAGEHEADVLRKARERIGAVAQESAIAVP